MLRDMTRELYGLRLFLCDSWVIKWIGYNQRYPEPFYNLFSMSLGTRVPRV